MPNILHVHGELYGTQHYTCCHQNGLRSGRWPVTPRRMHSAVHRKPPTILDAASLHSEPLSCRLLKTVSVIAAVYKSITWVGPLFQDWLTHLTHHATASPAMCMLGYQVGVATRRGTFSFSLQSLRRLTVLAWCGFNCAQPLPTSPTHPAPAHLPAQKRPGHG